SLMQEEVRNRRFAEVVRIEVHASMPQHLRDLLLAEFNEEQQDEPALPLGPADVYETEGLLDTADLLSLAAIELPALKDSPFVPVTPPRLATGANIFDGIGDRDVLLHHPFDSFTASVERFIQAASHDPDVVAIKLTLHPIGG